MKRLAGVVATGLLVCGTLAAQSSDRVLESYDRNFALGSIDTKLELLQSAGQDGFGGLGPLCARAVEFVLNNSFLLDEDPRVRALAKEAIRGLGLGGYDKANESLWRIFEVDQDTATRLLVLTTLGELAEGEDVMASRIGEYLAGENRLYRTGRLPDLSIVRTAVVALGSIGDPSSFAVIFATMSNAYSPEITEAARLALFRIRGDLEENILAVMKSGSLEAQREALSIAVGTDQLDDDTKAGIAHYALEVALRTPAMDALQKRAARELRFKAAAALGRYEWSAASSLAVEHFDALLGEMERGLADKDQLVEAVELLATMGTPEAASRLTLHLMVLNSNAERGKGYDEDVVKSVIEALGSLNDPVAYDDLMQVRYLNYTESVKEAARTAVSSITW